MTDTTPRPLGDATIVNLLRPPEPGDPISAAFLKSVHSAVSKAIQPPRQVKREVDYVSEDPSNAAAVAGTVEKGTVTAEADNTLTVTLVDTGSTTVAKPFNLRGATATRTVSGEDQEILIAYSGATILAMFVGEDHTGIVGVDWIDLNVDARAWAESL